jgi:hypothetical protein
MNGIEDDSNEKSKKPETDDEDFTDDEDDDDDEYDKTMLENYTTCIDSNDDVDEFVIFKDTLHGIDFC